MTETNIRTITRVVLYRLIAVTITAIWTGISTAIGIHIVLMIVHYITEKIWFKIKWGLTNE
jgi:hypothetical protein